MSLSSMFDEQHFLRQYCETKRVLSLLELLPTTECIGPSEPSMNIENLIPDI